jgi:IS30 family transposase
MAKVTRESLQKMLDSSNEKYVAQVVGRALVVLFNNQTADEKSMNSTNKDNGIGFAGCDALRGSLTAKSFMAHNNLLPWQVAIWTKKNGKGFSRLTKYHKQLNDAAAAKVKN